MKGDFSRISFDPLRPFRFSRVLMQQGRVLMDSDWNEHVAIQLHLLRTLAADLIGPHGGPKGAGFEISGSAPDGTDLENDIRIGAGHYYVDGWLVEQPEADGQSWRAQAAFAERDVDLEDDDKKYLVYLDVWEQHVSSIEVDGTSEIDRRDPMLLRELALGGPDTASRARIVWRVRLFDLANWPEELGVMPDDGDWKNWFGLEADGMTNLARWRARLRSSPSGVLRAMAQSGDGGAGDPCIVPPESHYRGLENQLYRIEIHDGGPAFDPDNDETGTATFKWSRDNGSVVLPIAEIEGARLTLGQWWRDARSGLEVGQWVELGDDEDETERDPTENALRRVKAIDSDAMTITLDEVPHLAEADPDRHPWVRRWDHRQRHSTNGTGAELTETNTLQVVEGEWIELEDGVRIWFGAADLDAAGTEADMYRSGDYWLIPARTAIGDVVWPRTRKDSGGDVEYTPKPLPPHGVQHHHAPLAVFPVTVGGEATIEDLRAQFEGMSG